MEKTFEGSSAPLTGISRDNGRLTAVWMAGNADPSGLLS